MIMARTGRGSRRGMSRSPRGLSAVAHIRTPIRSELDVEKFDGETCFVIYGFVCLFLSMVFSGNGLGSDSGLYPSCFHYRRKFFGGGL